MPSAVRNLILTLTALSLGIWSAANAIAQYSTINPPQALAFANFGYAVAEFDQGRFLVTSYQLDKGTNSSIGEAYFFGTNGSLLATFTNPVPLTGTAGSYFGTSISRVGSNRVLVGASSTDKGSFTVVGEAYLFNTNGSLVATFTNPVPENSSFFGDAVIGLSSNRVVVGADGARTNEGRAYLFNTNGTLVRTFTNPAPAADALFGFSLAALDANRFVVSAYGANDGTNLASGQVYLFNTNGTRLATMTNPSPARDASFGYAVATLANDRILVGAYGVSRSGLQKVGEAFLFSTNGVLLSTITNPFPSANAAFGSTLSAVGNDRIVIGADGTSRVGFGGVGEAYLFTTNGTLIATYTNPTPAGLDQFGWAVAGINSNRVIIGAPQVDLSTNINAGRSFVFFAPPAVMPPLRSTVTGGGSTLQLSWESSAQLLLQEASSLATPVAWSNSPASIIINGTTNLATVPLPSAGSERFYRLAFP